MASANLGFTRTVRSKRERAEGEEEASEEGTHGLDGDVCRVCRSEGSAEKPLFHPCLCTGSIKFIHQDCLIQWLKHSGKEYCELCKHKFHFAPIYRQDTPRRLPLVDLLTGVTRGSVSNLRHWVHLGFVAFMWLGIVPICLYRIYRFLLYGSIWSVASFPLELVALDHLFLDDIYGLVILLVSLLGFISLVWLKDQLGNGRAPAWLENDNRELNRLRLREAQDEVTAIRRHLDKSGARARERGHAPERIAAAQDITDLQDKLHHETKAIGNLQWPQFIDSIDVIWVREMELSHALGMSQWKYQFLLSEARAKRVKAIDLWYTETRTAVMREGGGNHEAVHVVEEIPSYEELELDLEHRTALESVGQWRKEGTEEGSVREQYRRLVEWRQPFLEEYQAHQNKIARLLAHRDKDGESPEMEEVSEEEKELILRIREVKKQLKEAKRREREIIHRQNKKEEELRIAGEERQNRWYNILLNRHQDDPLVVARRWERLPRMRPNIGQALADLARDQPPDVVNAGGENVEELTWGRLLGVDGSFRFLEHVLWVIFLNSALIFGLVYLPYQLGWSMATLFSLWDFLGIVTWRGVVATFIGYMIATCLVLGFYYGSGLVRLPRVKAALGMAFVGLKVGIILSVEAGVFPLMCGWWIDICSLQLFGSTMKNRADSLQSAPGTVMFLHWLAGMIFIFYLASFVMLLREVLRPGVLWFLRNLNDQNFHPVHEMIELPFQRHIRRFVMSCLLFGICVMLVLLVPTKAILLFLDGFLPYNLTLTSSVSPIREVQLELILLQFVIPTLLEHGNYRAGLKFLVAVWAKAASKICGLQSYLLDGPQTGGVVVDLHERVILEVPYDPSNASQEPAYTGPVQVHGPGFAPFKPYLRPPYFYARVCLFLTMTAIAAVCLSSVMLIVPVFTGRSVMLVVGMEHPPEIYTAAVGLYLVWLFIRVARSLLQYVSRGAKHFAKQFGIWTVQGMKCLVAGFLLFVVIPLLLGHMVDLLLITPLRVPSDRTPVFYPSTEWALGLLHTKCTCGAIWLTNTRFKRILDQVYQAGLRNLNLTFVIREVAWPVILGLSLAITAPYVFFMGVLATLGLFSYHDCLLLYRYFYPSILGLLFFSVFLLSSIKQCIRLCEHIKNEKYLIGRQLVNYSTEQAQSVHNHAPGRVEEVEQ